MFKSTVSDRNCEKIHNMAPDFYCCGAGTAADTEAVTGFQSGMWSLFKSLPYCSCLSLNVQLIVSITSLASWLLVIRYIYFLAESASGPYGPRIKSWYSDKTSSIERLAIFSLIREWQFEKAQHLSSFPGTMAMFKLVWCKHHWTTSTLGQFSYEDDSSINLYTFCLRNWVFLLLYCIALITFEGYRNSAIFYHGLWFPCCNGYFWVCDEGLAVSWSCSGQDLDLPIS